MENRDYFTIGEVSKICNISKKALRFYDKIGVISPDRISEDNNYRYYSRKTLLSVPIIKYYKQMGFKLKEMKEFLDGNTYSVLERSFRNKIDELKALQNEIAMMHRSVRDWYDLIVEAESVIENDVGEVAAKYIDPRDYLHLEQEFNYSYMESIINIEWTNFIESIENAITGPVILNFPSFRDHMNRRCGKVRILQETILDFQDRDAVTLGGYMAASCYHIGPHETIGQAYEKICSWVEKHGYKCADGSFERYVTDYWTTRNSDQFVTEIIIQISRN